MASLDIEPTRTSPNEAVADELRLRMVSANADLGPGPYDRASLKAFVCECGCHEPIPMSLRSFERARREGGGVIAPGHRVAVGESVLRREPAYWVVGRAA
ncbi:MAG: hypothetical protein ACXVY8_07915 [Gaiellaceae bacterium]